MDFSDFMISKKLLFSPAGKYLVDLDADFPLKLNYYDFSRPHAAIPNYHDHLEIAYIYEGEGCFTVGGNEFDARQGDVFVISSGVFHLLEARKVGDLKVVTLYFLPALIYEPGTSDLNLEYLLLFINRQQGMGSRVRLDSAQRGRILQLLDEIAGELRSRGSFYRIAVKNRICELLLLLNRASEVSTDMGGEIHRRLHDVHRLKPAFDFIRERYSEKLPLREIAAASKLSVTHLCRYFKKVTGKTLTEYIKRYRIDRAKELLIEDERSITWIAYEVGFESHSYFDRIFHDVTHFTPQEYRKRFGSKASVPG
jgi:AraC-like DNA-binding protein